MPRVAPEPLPPQGLPSPRDLDTAHRMINRSRTAPPGQRDSGRAGDGLTPTQAAVAHAVVDFHGYGDGWCFAGVVKLSYASHCSERTVEKALAGLVRRGWLLCERRPLAKVGGVLVGHYRLTPIAADLVPDEEVAAREDQYRAEVAARKAQQRAKRAAKQDTNAPLGATDVLRLKRETPPNVLRLRTADTDQSCVATDIACGRGGDLYTPMALAGTAHRATTSVPPVVAHPRDPLDTPRYDRRNPASYKVVDGIRVPLRARGESKLMEYRVTLLVDRLMPGRSRIAYPVAVLATENGLSLHTTAYALREVVARHGTDVDGSLVSDALDMAVKVEGRRHASIARWMRQRGITDALVP